MKYGSFSIAICIAKEKLLNVLKLSNDEIRFRFRYGNKMK